MNAQPLPPAALHAPLRDGEVMLRFVRIVSPGNRDLARYYHFRILAAGADVGHINLRIGDSEHIRRVVGQVGYGIRRRFRGRHYALAACRALAPVARLLAPEIILTCDPDNVASRRTLEKLVGAVNAEMVAVPPRDPHYKRGARNKLRYRWKPLSPRSPALAHRNHRRGGVH